MSLLACRGEARSISERFVGSCQVRSQRVMLLASRSGKQELFMKALGSRHFEQRKSASPGGTHAQSGEAH